jgi:hypothetical protein
MPSSTPKLGLAALAAGAITAPVGLALAADEPTAGAAPDARLAVPIAGHANVAAQMRDSRRAQDRARRRAARRADRPTVIPPVLRRIAECESHGNPRSIGGGGTYRGAYQFTAETWRAVGGHGDPAAASMAEQTRRAAVLLARSGPSQWPVCSA